MVTVTKFILFYVIFSVFLHTKFIEKYKQKSNKNCHDHWCREVTKHPETGEVTICISTKSETGETLGILYRNKKLYLGVNWKKRVQHYPIITISNGKLEKSKQWLVSEDHNVTYCPTFSECIESFSSNWIKIKVTLDSGESTTSIFNITGLQEIMLEHNL